MGYQFVLSVFFILPYPQMGDTKYLLVKGEEYDNKS